MSSQPRILIVEDDLLVALDLETIAADEEGARVTVCPSIAEAERLIAGQSFDFALLDIDVLDGKTFGLAMRLMALDVPFAFISGSRFEDVPDALRSVAFLRKPCPAQVVRQTIHSLACGGGLH